MNTQNKSCTCENQDMHRQRLQGKWVHTWATSHNKLIKKSEVNAQLRNNFEHVT